VGGGPDRHVLEAESRRRHAQARLDAEAGPVERQVEVRYTQDETGRGRHRHRGEWLETVEPVRTILRRN
jgi:hypothetical protein